MNAIVTVVGLYRVWRVRRWLTSSRLRRNLLEASVAMEDGTAVPDVWPRSAPRFVRKWSVWLILAIGLFVWMTAAQKRRRDVARAHVVGGKAFILFDAVERILPTRVVDEEFGDAREDIGRMARIGEWGRISIRVVTTLWNGCWNSVDYWLS